MKLDELENELYNRSYSNRNGFERVLGKYVKMSSLIGGMFFSGVGYTVGSVGSLIKDITSSLIIELPTMYRDIVSGNGYEVPAYLLELGSQSLLHSREIGSFGAIVGLIGGTVFFGRIRESISNIGKR